MSTVQFEAPRPATPAELQSFQRLRNEAPLKVTPTKDGQLFGTLMTSISVDQIGFMNDVTTCMESFHKGSHRFGCTVSLNVTKDRNDPLARAHYSVTFDIAGPQLGTKSLGALYYGDFDQDGDIDFAVQGAKEAVYIFHQGKR